MSALLPRGSHQCDVGNLSVYFYCVLLCLGVVVSLHSITSF